MLGYVRDQVEYLRNAYKNPGPYEAGGGYKPTYSSMGLEAIGEHTLSRGIGMATIGNTIGLGSVLAGGYAALNVAFPGQAGQFIDYGLAAAIPILGVVGVPLLAAHGMRKLGGKIADHIEANPGTSAGAAFDTLNKVPGPIGAQMRQSFKRDLGEAMSKHMAAGPPSQPFDHAAFAKGWGNKKAISIASALPKTLFKMADYATRKTVGHFLGATGGISGLGLATAHGAIGIAGGLFTTAIAGERLARGVLTGGFQGTHGPLDAWFPGFRVHGGIGAHSDISTYKSAMNGGASSTAAAAEALVEPGIDLRRIAPNPKAIRRIIALQAVRGMAEGVGELLSPRAAPPTAFFDGRYMRHINSMGADANYGQAVLGPNSILNSNTASMLRQAMVHLG